VLEYSELSEEMQRKVDRHYRTVPDQMLAGVANAFKGEPNGDGSLGDTLIVGGSIISGTTLTERAWAEAVGQQPGGASAPLAKGLIDMIDDREQEPELSEEERDAMDEKEALEHIIEWHSPFIHLVNAQQVVGENFLPQGACPCASGSPRSRAGTSANCRGTRAEGSRGLSRARKLVRDSLPSAGREPVANPTHPTVSAP